MSSDDVLNATVAETVTSTVASAVAAVVSAASASASTSSEQQPAATTAAATLANILIAAPTTAAATMGLDPLSHVGDGIFLQTKTAQGIAGAFVWVALFLACQQVRTKTFRIFCVMPSIFAAIC